jgi:S1-C subfamily serine protease
MRILGTACGLGVSGSGWVARRGVVVTAAHVVAGQTDTVVVPPSSSVRYRAYALAYDPHDDVAVLAVPGLSARALPLADPRPGASVAILGYPENGPLTATPGRLGRTAKVLTEDAYGHGPVARAIAALRAPVRHGDSGGPAVDASGAVEATVFAARIGEPAGYGVPTGVVRRVLASAVRRVSTGPCAR